MIPTFFVYWESYNEAATKANPIFDAVSKYTKLQISSISTETRLFYTF